MQLTSVAEGSVPGPGGVAVDVVLRAAGCNVRVIRIGPGHALPAHTHGASDVVLHVVEGTGRIDLAEGAEIAPGTLVHLHGDEALRVANTGPADLVLLGVFAPPFPAGG
ncbi:MAG: cupin domain-containing protein [Acidimicrobiia bacterium]